MNDTGLLNVGAVQDNVNVFFNTVWVGCGSGIALYLNGGYQTGTSFSTSTLTTGVRIQGCEVILSDTYGLLHADAELIIQVSNDAGSSFSSGISTGALGTSSPAPDRILGSSSNLWGLDWDGFTNLANLHVKATGGGGQTAASDCVKIKIYYQDPLSSLGKLHIKSGKMSVLSGKVKIT